MTKTQRALALIAVLAAVVVSGRAEAADLTGPHRYRNTTGTAVNDLHVTFAGTGGTLTDPVITEEPLGAGGRIRIGDPPANTVIIEWPTEIRPGETIAFTVRSRFRPITSYQAFWTRDGQPAGEATPVAGSGDTAPAPRVTVVDGPPGTTLRVTMDAKVSNLVPDTIEVVSAGGKATESYQCKFQSSTATGVMQAAYVANRDAQGRPVWFASLQYDGYSALKLHIALGAPAAEGGEQLTLEASGLPEGYLPSANGLLAAVENQPAIFSEFTPRVSVSLRRGTKTVVARAEPGTSLEPWFEIRRVLLQTRLHQHLTRASRVYAASRVASSLSPPVAAHTILSGLRLQRMLQLNGPEWTAFVPTLLSAVLVADLGSVLRNWDLAGLLGGGTIARTCTPQGPSMTAWPGEPTPASPQIVASTAWREKAEALAKEIVEDKIRRQMGPACVAGMAALCNCQLKSFKVTGPQRDRVVSWDSDPPPWRRTKIKSGEPHENKPATGPAGPIGLPGGFFGDPFSFIDMDLYTRRGTVKIQDFDVWFLTVTLTCGGSPPLRCPQGDQTHTRKYYDILEPPTTTTREVTETLKLPSFEFVAGAAFEHHGPPDTMPPVPEQLTPKIQ
jgi:hypothetical protein